jgi:hypothetical protein
VENVWRTITAGWEFARWLALLPALLGRIFRLCEIRIGSGQIMALFYGKNALTLD